MIPWKRNFLAKALSLIAAIVLWAFVMSEQNPIVEVQYMVPVHLVNTQAEQIIEDAPHDIKVVLRGQRNTILHLDQNTLVATVNMKHVGFGKESVPIHFEAPNGLTLVKQEPSIANVLVDSYDERKIPLTVKPVGTQSKGFGLEAIKVAPEYIVASGASARLKKVASAVMSVKIDGVRDDFKSEEPITLYNAQGEEITGLNILPTMGEVDIKVDKDVYDKNLFINPVIEGMVADGYEIGQVKVEPKSITVLGKQKDVQELTSLVCEPIDISDATGTIKQKVAVILPDGIISDQKEVEVIIPVNKIGAKK